MKSKLLSKEDLLKMEGQKVWVDWIGVKWSATSKKEHSGIYIIKDKQLTKTNSINWLNIDRLDDEGYECSVYEWIEDKKILIGDDIRNLHHGTKINFVDIYSKNVRNGIINQDKKYVKHEYSSDHWYFINLEECETKAWVIEEPKQETEKIHKDLIMLSHDWKLVDFPKGFMIDNKMAEKILKEGIINQENIVKEYNLVEMVEEMKSTGCHFKDSILKDVKYGLIDGLLQYCEGNRNWKEIGNHSPMFLLKKFIKIENKSVDFMTAIKSGKNIKVEHKYIDKLSSLNTQGTIMSNMFILLKNNEYMSSNELLSALGWITNKHIFNEIVVNGKWYIKED